MGKKCQKTIHESQVFHERSNLSEFIAGSVFCRICSLSYVSTPQFSSKTDSASSTTELSPEAHQAPPPLSTLPRALTPLHSPYPTAHIFQLKTLRCTSHVCQAYSEHDADAANKTLALLKGRKDIQLLSKQQNMIKYRKCANQRRAYKRAGD